MRRSLRNLAAAVAATLIGTVGSAHACLFDGVMGQKIGGGHPQSIDVAFAISDAVGNGIVDRADSTTQGQQAYMRAVDRLAWFQRYFPEESSGAQNVSVLLVDSQLWVRFNYSPAGYDLISHIQGPDEGDVVVLTGEPVLAGLLNGKLQLEKALELRLIVVSGASEAASRFASGMSLRTNTQSAKRRPVPFFSGAGVRAAQ